MKNLLRGIKGWMYGAAAGVLMLAGLNAVPAAQVPGQTVAFPNTTESSDFAETSKMEVHFIDVGQGDATLIISDGHYMLIDAGDNNKGTTVQLYLKKLGVEKLDYLVLTHTDSDHIGGADVIINKFDIENIFLSDFEKDNAAYRELKEAMEYKYMDFSIPEVGSEYILGNASFTVLAPNDTYDNPNDSGIALLLRNGEDTFLFSGDCEYEAEKDIISNGIDIDCDVYKVAHHGSSDSSSMSFLDAMTPEYAVISCEEGNSYGHPHAEILNNLRTMDVQVFRTDEQGSVVAYSDGTAITWNCASSESWKAGEIQGTPEPTPQATPEPTVVPAPEPTQAPTPQPTPEPVQSENTGAGNYAVNGKNGKIHMVGACPATGTGKNAMKEPIYFNTFEEAEARSIGIDPGLEKRKCGNCWK